jgi:hypothetical protein
MNRAVILSVGLGSIIAMTWLWHGPLGAGERFAARIESAARAQLDRDEMVHVQARMERAPLVRRLIITGPADDFQRREIKRRLEAQAGVGEAVWDASSLEAEARL